MSPDIFSSSAVDLVIFTVADAKSLPDSYSSDGIVSYGKYGRDWNDFGMSLFVVTVPADETLYPNLLGRRVLPGGYLRESETLLQASRRIAYERLGLSLKLKLRQLGTFDDPYRDPNSRVISFAYWAMVDFSTIRKYLGGRDQIGLELVNSNTYMDYFEKTNGSLDFYDGVSRFGDRTMPSPSSFKGHRKRFSDELEEGQILGLDHDKMVFFGWRQLRHAFDGRQDPFRVLGLNPLGTEFRLSELQEFRDVCRGERIQRDLFRRIMLNNDSFIKDTGKTDRSKPGKPANLYAPLADEMPDEYFD